MLVGLHPSATQLVLPDRTPAFQGVGGPKPLLEAPKGGTTIVIGVGLYTNGINPRAVAAKWMAGPQSMMNDVRFLGGHGTTGLDGRRENPYNNAHSADPDLERRWDSQYPSLWVTDGGGGTFFDIWTPSTFAQSGLLVSDTATSGRVYELSSEHHVRYEVQLHGVSNWELHALQTEEERGESGFALPLEIRDSSRDHGLEPPRLPRDQQRPAVSLGGEAHAARRTSASGTSTRTATARWRSTRRCSTTASAWACASASSPGSTSRDARRSRARPQPSRVLEPGATVERLAGGFHNISGGAADGAGDFYFVDAHWQRIHRWSVAERRVTTVADAPLSPVNLAFDTAGDLLVVSYAGNGTVYALKPGATGEPTLLRSAAGGRAPRPHGDPSRRRLAPATRRERRAASHAPTTTSPPTAARSSRPPRPSSKAPPAGASRTPI